MSVIVSEYLEMRVNDDSVLNLLVYPLGQCFDANATLSFDASDTTRATVTLRAIQEP